MYNAGDVLLLEFPNTDGAQGKPRPGLVIRDTGDDDVLVARITSQAQPSAYEVPVVEWKEAGLRLPSTIRIHKLATLHKRKVRQTIGILRLPDRKAVTAALRSLLADWQFD